MNLRIVLFLLFLCLGFNTTAQDTLFLLGGKTIVARNIEVGGYRVSYMGLKEGSKLKSVRIENLFSIKHANGSEQMFYVPDSLEEDDFTVDQMRMFIRGEQDALAYYKNTPNKLAAFAAGGGVSLFGFYGIIGPAIYSTVVGSFSPDMSKQKVSDPALIQVEEYREGYQRKVRDKKIKNSLLFGLAGFAVGVATFSIATHN